MFSFSCFPKSAFRAGAAALLLALAPLAAAGKGAVRIDPVPVPAELLSSAFTITVNGLPVSVAHAAASYEFASFDFASDKPGPVEVAITAAEPGFWDKGVDIQPWRLGLRPVRDGQTIRFQLNGPAKLSIARPGDFLNHAQMLFLFAGAPPTDFPRNPAIHVYMPGIYHQSLNPKSGDIYYLEPGSYFYGSLNLWNVENVKILGRGTIVYEGTQDPANDEGWMQKPDWHCIGSMNAKNVQIDGLTCLVRARTWSIQMKDSTGFRYDDLRVIGGNPGNANQDGMDWLGGGDTVVRNSFIRASDDVFAMQGNWDGYHDEDLLRPGKDVQDILIEDSQLSTSISNIVRAGWPRKTYNSRNFTLRNSDILHAGIGACGQTFGLLGFWGAQGAKGEHTGFTFENIFLDNWYSLVQIDKDQPSLHDFTFRNIWALDQPPLASSNIGGQVHGITFENVKVDQTVAANDADLNLVTTAGAEPAHFVEHKGPVASFTVDPPVIAPKQKVTFTARTPPGAASTNFTWLFGDGTQATGRKVTHRFADADGTLLDGSGRFRVLLHVADKQGHQDWASQGVVVVGRWHEPPTTKGEILPGLAWQIYPGVWTELPGLNDQKPVFAGISPGIQSDSHGFTRYVTAWDGFLDIPADGGYTFHLMARDGARLVIDGMEVAKTGPPFAQVCGAPGNAVRYVQYSLGLRAGKHAFHLEGLHSVSQGGPRLLWEGPALPLTDIPPAAYSHLRVDVLTQ